MISNKNNFFKTSDGTNIYFEEHGEGTPILFVPGFLCTSKFFMRNITILARTNKVIVMDSRGHGSSDKTLQNLTIERCAQDVKELIEHLNLNNVLLAGWSLGGSVVMSYWEQFKNYRISALGIIDSALYPFASADWNSHSLKGFNLDAMTAVMSRAIADYAAYCRAFASVIWKNPPELSDVEWVTTEMSKTPPWIAFALYSDFLHRDYVSVLPSVTIPTLLCASDSMAIPRSVDMSKVYKQQLTASSELHTFDEGGHMMFYLETEKFNKIVLDFVAKHCK